MRILGLTVLFVLLAGRTCTAQSVKPLPIVVSASVPFYPRVAQLAHIEGTVRLRISTDGKGVSSADVESGPPMLARAAKENVKTWQFEQHIPTTFETTFRYVLTNPKCVSECNCDGSEQGSAQLRFPTEISVSGHAVVTCDPAETIRR